MTAPVIEFSAHHLEEIAWALDALTKFAKILIQPIAEADGPVSEVCIEVNVNGAPMKPSEARELLNWMEGTEIQDDLRAMAERLNREAS
jgi:hypothetical protein